MTVLTISPTDAIWIGNLQQLLAHGQVVSPRGINTKEVLSNRFVTGLSQPVITVPQRELSYSFMAAEASWILSGGSFVEEIERFAPSIKQFSDDGITFRGAYGPKVVEQIGYVIDTLANDPDSRQAVLSIWRERPAPSKDIPCTISVQFFIRNDLLFCIDNMRSSDIWLGYPYDVFNFSMLALAVRNHVSMRLKKQIGMGALILNAGSSHIYEKQWGKATEIFNTYKDALLDPSRHVVTHMVPEFLYDLSYAGLADWLADRAEKGDLLDHFAIQTSEGEVLQ
jgi:thymidylate synthase